MEVQVHIKNMVCDRCKMVVSSILRNLGAHVVSVSLGVATLSQPLSEEQLLALKEGLEEVGFQLIDDREEVTVDRMRAILRDEARRVDGSPQRNLSTLISEAFHSDYSQLSALFRDVEGRTVEQFYIVQRIEKVKELLENGELRPGEIADQMGFSSAAHLSTLFKRVTGLTPSQFRQMNCGGRIGLDLL